MISAQGQFNLIQRALRSAMVIAENKPGALSIGSGAVAQRKQMAIPVIQTLRCDGNGHIAGENHIPEDFAPSTW
jgi:hypothetical protein